MSKKWIEFYSSEQELINDMLKTKSDVNSYPLYQVVKGYEFIESFKKYYNQHGILTDKQMTQLKRLAWAVYDNTHSIIL